MPPIESALTILLAAHRAGDRDAFDRLVEHAYDELRVLAHQQLRRAPRGATLETRVLIHEAYMRLADQSALELADQGHFRAVMARAMRFVVVDHARRRRAGKRGGGATPTTFEPEMIGAAEPAEAVLAIHRAIEGLERFAPRLARIVECRYFAGFTDEEIAAALDVSARTVQRDWLRARAWLQRELDGGSASAGPTGSAPAAE